MNTISITLKSHYGTLPELKIRIGEEKYSRLTKFMNCEQAPYEASPRTAANAIAFDLDRLADKEKPEFFTISQLGKIIGMYAAGDGDFYETIEVKE